MVTTLLVSTLATAPQEVIDLPVDDIQLCANIEELFRISDGPTTVSSVGFDASGNIRIGHFSPSRGLRVIAADSAGRLRFGLKGGATQMVALSNGRTIVPDRGRGVFHVFLPNGVYSHQVRFGSLSWQVGTQIRADYEGGLFMRSRTRSDNEFDTIGFATSASMVDGPRQVTRLFLDADEARFELFASGWTPAQPAFRVSRAVSGEVSGRPSTPGTVNRVALLPRFLWGALPGGGIAMSDSSAYAIKILDASGNMVRVLRRALPPRPITRSVQVAYRRLEIDAMNALMADRRGRPSAELIADMLDETEDMLRRSIAEMEFADEIPLVDDLLTASDGTIWVRRTPVDGFPIDASSDATGTGRDRELQQRQAILGSAPIDVLTARGEYVGTMEMRWPAALGPNGLVAYVDVDGFGIPTVLVGRTSAIACG